MQYATVCHTAPPPIQGYSIRARRNTMEPSGRQHQNMIQLVKASQRQQYAHEYIDDRSSFVRAQQAEEERIQQDMERAMRAQRRNKARKVTRASKAAERTVQSIPVDDWRHGGNVRRPSIGAYPQSSVGMVQHVERGCLETFQFPQVQILKTNARPPLPRQFHVAQQSAPPVPIPSPNKRLAPIPRFNPFVRARSESLSSVIDEEQPERDPVKRKRNATVSGLFARIHLASRSMGPEPSHGVLFVGS